MRNKLILSIFGLLLAMLVHIPSVHASALESTVWRGSTIITNSSGTFTAGQTWQFYGVDAAGVQSMDLVMDKPLRNYTSNIFYSVDTSAPSCSWTSDPDNTQDIYHCTTSGSNKIYTIGMDVQLPSSLTYVFSVKAPSHSTATSSLHP